MRHFVSFSIGVVFLFLSTGSMAQCELYQGMERYDIEKELEELREVKNSPETDKLIKLFSYYSSEEYVTKRIFMYYGLYKSGRLDPITLQQQLVKFIEQVEHFRAVRRYLISGINEDIRALEDCLSNFPEGQNSVPFIEETIVEGTIQSAPIREDPTPSKGTAVYVMHGQYPMINKEKTILQEGNFMDRNYKSIKISEGNFNERRVERKGANGDIIGDWSMNYDFKLNGGSGFPSKLRPGDRISIEAFGIVSADKRSGRPGVTMRLHSSGFSEVVAEPKGTRKESMWIGHSVPGNQKKWTLTAGKPGREMSVTIVFTDGRHSWQNLYVWEKE